MKEKLAQRGSRGAAMLEFSIVLPLLFIIPICVMEFQGYLRRAQFAVVASQESANDAFRQCSDLKVYRRNAGTGVYEIDPVRSAGETRECLNTVASRYQGSIERILPGTFAGIRLNVFRYDLPDPVVCTNTNRFIETGTTTDPVAPTSYFSATAGRIDKSGLQVVRREWINDTGLPATQTCGGRQRIVTSEVVWQYTRLRFSGLPFRAWFLGEIFGPVFNQDFTGANALREATIL